MILMTCAMAAISMAQVSPSDALIDYEERFTRLNKAYAKEPDNVENLYNMAMFYFDNSHPMRNLPMAMKYIQRAEAKHIELLENDKLGELTRLARKNITLTTLRQTKQAISDAAYNTLEVRTDMSRVELDTYLDAFGIDIELVRLLRQRRINQVYDEDLRKGTAEAYYHFIFNYPGTREAEQMEERLSHLAPGLFEGVSTESQADTIAVAYELSPSVQRAAAKQKSRIAYANASKRNTIAAYNDFLSKYPSSDEHLQAREKLATLLEMKYSALYTAQEYADFVESNADNALADSALLKLRRLIFDKRDIEAARLYLTRFKLDPFYNDVYNKYYSWHAEEGNMSPIEKFIEENPDYPHQRAVEADKERAVRIDRVNLMEDFIEVDYNKYAGYVRQMTGKRIAIVPLQRMIQSQLTMRNYTGALARVRQFDLCFDNVGRSEYMELQQLLNAPLTGHKPSSVLTATYNIQNPSYNKAENRIYYTRIGSSRRICYAEKKGGVWQPAGDAKFSNTDNDGLTIYGFYADGTHMLLGSAGDIWIAVKDGDQWRVSDIPPYPVNTDYIETDAYMLPDGSGMLLASDRPNGQNLQPSGALFHGDTALATDLYFIPYTQNGWGAAVNLGVSVNTPYCERSPILSRNLKTLYFVSDGRGGLGYGDVYTCTRTNIEDWTGWSKPRNIGKELNTGYNEASVAFGPDEKSIIVTSNYNLGRYSAYSFPTTHDVTNTYIPYTLDVLGMESFLFRVRVVDIAQQDVTQVVEYSGEGHSVELYVHKDKRYAVLGDAGMYFVPAVMLEPKSKEKKRLKGYTLPVMVAMDKAVPLEAVDFEKSSAKLLPLAVMQLEQLARFMTQNPDGVVEVVVNVAGRDDAHCYNLSLERGRAIRDNLVLNGVEESRISISAYGNVNAKKGAVPGVSIRFRDR